jgi:hypothetical protein
MKIELQYGEFKIGTRFCQFMAEKKAWRCRISTNEMIVKGK